jgi:MoaA/NifB/PqqE/SkfB family radical SAM enzyme
VFRNLYSARKSGCSFVDFTGGEPLLHQELPAFLKEAKRIGFITSVTTNCLLFKKRAQELDNLIDLLHFSIDSSDASEHNRIRGVDCFDHVIDSISEAKKYRLVPDLLFTYTNENIDRADGIYTIAKNNKLMMILDPVFDPWSSDHITRKTHQKALSFSRRSGVYLNRAHLLLRAQGGNHIREPLCRAMDSTIVILPDNSIALPCFHHRSFMLPLNGDIATTIHSDEYKRHRLNQGKFTFCEGCHINCYFDPSYNYMMNHLTWQSIMAKLRYAWTKHILYKRPIPRRKRVNVK